MPDQFLRTSAAARILECSCESIRLWERAGKLNAVKADGGMRLFRLADVEKLRAERAKRRREEDRQ